jgi:hypothetical protein
MLSPLLLLRELEHQASPSTVQRLQPLLVLQFGIHDILRLFDFTMDQISHDGNKERSFAPLPLVPNGRNKSTGAHDRIPPDPANFRHRCTVTFAGGAFYYSPLRQIKKDRPQEGLYLRTRETLGQSPLLGRSVGPHAAARRSTSSAEDEAATNHRLIDESSVASPNTKA